MSLFPGCGPATSFSSIVNMIKDYAMVEVRAGLKIEVALTGPATRDPGGGTQIKNTLECYFIPLNLGKLLLIVFL